MNDVNVIGEAVAKVERTNADPAQMRMSEIKIAETDSEINSCYQVMSELRTHLEPAQFLEQVKRQADNSGFRIVYLTDGEIKAVGGFRIAEWLAGGKYLEIEDLVAKESERSKGYGGELFDWILNFARQEKCSQIKLVSNVKRFAAHKFYLNKQMIIEAHYFSMPI